MVSEEVEYIKKHERTKIDKAAIATYGVIFGYRNNIVYDACFARLDNRIGQQKGGGKIKSSLQYLLRYEPKGKTFDYKSLIKGLNEIFGYYFKITMYSSGVAKCKIINIKEVRKLPNKHIKYSAYCIILVLLRGIDGEFLSKTKANHKGKKINNWRDMIYGYYKLMGIYGHGINDDIAELGQRLRQSKTPGNEKLFVASIENYLNILKTAFGSKYDYKKVGKLPPFVNRNRYSSRGQTPSFKYIEKIIHKGRQK